MDTATFEAALKSKGITDIEHRDGAPNFAAKPHTHPFEVHALVLAGEFGLDRNGALETYRVGETFTMEPGCMHAEIFGPEGSKYVLGRRHPEKTG